MSIELESMAKMLMNSPQGSKIISGLDKLNSIMATDSGRQLIAQLAGGGSDALKAAAQAANNAQPGDQARVLLTVLISSKDGAALMTKLVEAIGV